MDGTATDSEVLTAFETDGFVAFPQFVVGEYYFTLEPCEAVTMWFALEDVDEENGCVPYVRGSHNGSHE